MSDLEDIVFQGIGEASMCWSERPKGVFDSAHAKRIGENIMHAIEAYIALQSQGVDILPMTMKVLDANGNELSREDTFIGKREE